MTEQKFGFSEKQWMFFDAKPKRLNFLSGSVRSGKTVISLWKWAVWVMEQPKNREMMMIGKNLGALKRNCLMLLQDMVGEANFQYSLNAKAGMLFGHRIHLEGANDERSENKIRGMTLGGAYCDEVTLYPESFFVMLLTRLSDSGACLFATCNPDHPTHYIKAKYIDNPALDAAVWQFYLDDNIYLDKDYVENMKKEFTGVFYDRFIRGLWVVAEGLIFPNFADNPQAWIVKEAPRNIDFITIGVDFGGNRSKTVFVASAVLRGYAGICVLADSKIEGDKGSIDGDKVNKEFIAFVKRVRKEHPNHTVRYGFGDNAEQYLIAGIQAEIRRQGMSVAFADCAKMPINDRIRCKSALISTHRWSVMQGCNFVIDSTRGILWDSEKHNDTRLDDFTTDVDTADAEEYSWERWIKHFELKRGGGTE